MKYKIGDKIIIKSEEDIKKLRKYKTNYKSKDDVVFVEEMYDYCEKEAKITYVLEGKNNNCSYRLDIDNGFWTWSEDFFDQEKEISVFDTVVDDSGCGFCLGRDNYKVNCVDFMMVGKELIVDHESFEINYCPMCGKKLE